METVYKHENHPANRPAAECNFPLLLGYFVYLLGSYQLLPQLVKNYLPDGLWAYAFISAILIIWNRQLNYVWLFISFLLAACFELLQHYQLLAGTADIADIMTYFLFMGAGLFSNRFFKEKDHTQTI